MISLDGFFEGQGKEIDWHNVDSEFNDFAIEQLDNASLLIFGRATYKLMAEYWPSSAALRNDPVIARKMNSMPKIVFSKTLMRVNWENTTIKDNIGEVKKLKLDNDRDILIFGSANLASSFINCKLIDEFRIMINPILLGRGNPLFKSLDERLKLKILRTRSFHSGNVLLYYKPLY
jgi:dihydrofolate reductase